MSSTATHLAAGLTDDNVGNIFFPQTLGARRVGLVVCTGFGGEANM